MFAARSQEETWTRVVSGYPKRCARCSSHLSPTMYGYLLETGPVNKIRPNWSSPREAILGVVLCAYGSNVDTDNDPRGTDCRYVIEYLIPFSRTGNSAHKRDCLPSSQTTLTPSSTGKAKGLEERVVATVGWG